MLEPNTQLDAIRVVILEDAEVTLEGLLQRLSGADFVVLGASDSATDILDLVRMHRPDVAILDLRIYGDDKAGFKVASRIAALSPATKCIIYTELDSTENEIAAADAGIALFAGKAGRRNGRPSIDVLVRMVAGRSVGGSDEPASGRARRYTLPRLNLHGHGQDDIHLTSREQEVLYWVGEGLSDRETAAKLVIEPCTIKKHLQGCFRKLGIHRRWPAMGYARSQGLIPPPKSKISARGHSPYRDSEPA